MHKSLYHFLRLKLSHFYLIFQMIFVLLVLSVTFPKAAETESRFIYASPLYLKTNSWQDKAATVLGVELQNYVINDELPWEKYDYTADTALNSWYQDNITDTIHSLPEEFASTIKGDFLVLLYNLSGSEKDIGKEVKIYPKVGGIAINTGSSEISGELNKYDNLFYTLSVYNTSGSIVFTIRAHASDIDDAVESIVESCTQMKLSGKAKEYSGSLTIDTSGFSSKFQLGQGLFITGSVMTFAGFGVIVSGTSEDAQAIGFTLYSIGQAGLILCGSSNLIMRSAILKATGLNYSISPKGYVLYGSGLVLFAGGLGLVGAGINNDAFPLILTGIASVTAGQVLSVVSWIPFVKDYKRMNNKFKNIKVSPSVGISTDGNINIGVIALFGK